MKFDGTGFWKFSRCAAIWPCETVNLPYLALTQHLIFVKKRYVRGLEASIWQSRLPGISNLDWGWLEHHLTCTRASSSSCLPRWKSTSQLRQHQLQAKTNPDLRLKRYNRSFKYRLTLSGMLSLCGHGVPFIFPLICSVTYCRRYRGW